MAAGPWEQPRKRSPWFLKESHQRAALCDSAGGGNEVEEKLAQQEHNLAVGEGLAPLATKRCPSAGVSQSVSLSDWLELTD